MLNLQGPNGVLLNGVDLADLKEEVLDVTRKEASRPRPPPSRHPPATCYPLPVADARRC